MGAALSMGKLSWGESVSPEYLVKAAFLYNFAKFVEWPDKAFMDDQTPIILYILGKDPFGNALDSLQNKTVKGRNLMITRLKDIHDSQQCHILFISQSEKKNLARIFEKIKKWNVLTVSDIENFAQEGGIINFITKENKIRFAINVDAAQRSDLTVSSKLLKLAIIVKEQ
jgi:hypothetical protein